MVFWGVEVKSQEPITLKPSEPTNVLRRLHLSQATLGLGKATDKSTLQCTVGYKSPVLLCVLTPNKFDSCKLNIKFDEDDDVVFSVIGTRSIHVTGYFLDRKICCSGSNQNDIEKSESYGEDIGVSDMEKDRGKDDYDYNDSFINDNNDSFNNNQIKDISSKRLREQLQGGTSARAADAFVEDSLNNDQKIPLPSKVKIGNVNLDKTSETRTHSQNALVKMFNKYARKDKPLVDNEKKYESLKNEKLIASSSGVSPSQNGDLTPLMKKRKMERIVETTNIVQEKLFEAQAINKLGFLLTLLIASSSGVSPSQNGDLTPLMKKRKMERIVETTNIVQEKLFEAQAINK